ncbi:carboxypeptidase-like regulatory domain-containing protein [Patescibacteria group bacterium]|nr:carboxypeptidase-like regulatory domain-containing protein [Patescibacteria group bacterium]
MTNGTRKTAVALGVAGGVGALIYFATRAKAAPPPPPPPPPGYAQLYGRVTDAGEPISMALVTLDGMTSPTTIEGDYLFVNLEPGEYNITFSKDDYETRTATITLTEGNNEFNIALTPSTFTGFILALQNLPPEAVLWNANFAENTFNYDPIADSGWIAVGDYWDYPSDPRGCTTLRVWALDADNNILFDIYNLGPVNNGKNYIFNCATQTLIES